MSTQIRKLASGYIAEIATTPRGRRLHPLDFLAIHHSCVNLDYIRDGEMANVVWIGANPSWVKRVVRKCVADDTSDSRCVPDSGIVVVESIWDCLFKCRIDSNR